MAFTDRGGRYVSSISLEAGMSSPCSVDVTNGVYAVTSLGDATCNNKGGCVGIFDDETNRLLSTLEVDKIIRVDGFHHPHHARFLPNGDLVMCFWGTREENAPCVAFWRKIT